MIAMHTTVLDILRCKWLRS